MASTRIKSSALGLPNSAGGNEYLPGGGYEVPYNQPASALFFIPIFGEAGLFYQPGGTIGVYGGGSNFGGGVYLNLGGGTPKPF
ncbi:MAG: hypothetical protein M3Y24_01415 [Acidobacteriota bacterium]|nr:hypothetical protein [Acidobacteriota bacterium]